MTLTTDTRDGGAVALVISTLLRHADDLEASALREVLVKAGLLWRCATCQSVYDEETSCAPCGTAKPEASAPDAGEEADPLRALSLAIDTTLRVGGFGAPETSTYDGMITHVVKRADGGELRLALQYLPPERQLHPDRASCFRVEYDEKFFGGDYTFVGDRAYVPFSLLTNRVSPEEAFEQHTGVERCHIININLDEEFDADGERLDGGERLDEG